MAADRSFGRVAIVGLGLMGGSLARALRRREDPPVVSASSRDDADLEAARRAGVVDRVSGDPDAVVADADLIVYATPVGVTVELLERHRDLFDADAVLTDLGSVKRPVVTVARTLGLADRFVGGHPMAGHHASGFGAARADIYRGALVWLTPGAAAAPAEDAAPVARVARFWRSVGARPRPVDAAAHDRMVAWSSQLPQVAATALASTLAEEGIEGDTLGPGGRDTTRLASSPADLWVDLLVQNADLVEAPLRSFREALDGLMEAIRSGDGEAIRAAFRAGRKWREGE